MCTLTDFDNSGSVNSMDLIAVVNVQGSLVTPENAHFNVVPALEPFPQSIDRADMLAAVDCWGNRETPSEGGRLDSFELVANGEGFDLNVNLEGPVSGIAAYIKLPGNATFDQAATLDLLGTGFTRDLAESPQSCLLLNQYTSMDYASSNLVGNYTLGFLQSNDLNLNNLEDLPPGEPFYSGISVRVTYADGREEVISKRFRYFQTPDPILQAAVENFFGYPQGSLISYDDTEAVITLVLNNAGLTTMAGLEAFATSRSSSSTTTTSLISPT